MVYAPLAYVLFTAFSIFGTRAHAHEDPPGDVHPCVVTTSGRFEVYFTNNRVADRRVYRTIYSAGGNLIADRELFDAKAPDSEESSSLQMDVIGGRPSFQFTPNGKDRPKTIEPQLPAGAYTDCYVLGWLSEPKFVMRDSPAMPAKDKTWPFSLRIIDLFSGALLDSAVIGTPGRIYDFARTSSVLSADAELIVAWMEEKRFLDEKVPLKDGETATIRNSAFRVVVTRWLPKLRRPLHTIVAPAVDSNVSISIGRINNVVLIAWHELGKIRIRIVDLATARFVPRLPELRRDFETEKAVMKEVLGMSSEK